jgi:hypothetical protein
LGKAIEKGKAMKHKQLKAFEDKPGTILDAFSVTGEHLGTIMVCHLPTVLEGGKTPREVAIVIVKQALPIKYRSLRLPRGFVGLWANDTLVSEPA